jgi:5-formyltetrahydrofolate cyclo-ligase
MTPEARDSEPSSPPCLMHEFEADLLSRPPDWPAIRAFRKEQRTELLAARAALPLRERQRRSELIRARVDETLALPRNAVLGIYWPIRGEPDLREIAKRHVENGGRAALPVVTAKSAPVEFWQWEPDVAMRVGFWKIPVPAERRVLAPDALLIPLVGHDASGYRLGYGGGSYDRTLAAITPRPLCVGVGYAAAALATIHPQPHDIPMDVIVTDEWVRRFHAAGRI